MTVVETTPSFEVLISASGGDYPTLSRAIRDSARAANPRIEWNVDRLQPGTQPEPSVSLSFWHNYTQIFRAQKKSRPDLTVDAAAHEAADDMLAQLERALNDGIPYRENIVSMLGGWKHYLGRPLNDNDVLILRVLRDPRLQIIEQDQWDVYLDYPIAEWLCEVSLQVIPQAA